jgi:oleate hydratase
MSLDKKAYLIGGGIGSLAAAAFMVRDGGMAGQDITIFEAGSVMGGSLDGAGTPEQGYTLRGGRMLTFDNYECTWGLFKDIPSLTDPLHSVYQETVDFNALHPPHSMARLVDRRRAIVPVRSMGFDMKDRLELLKLTDTDEKTLGASRITDWLSPAFFDTEFWFMWATTFAFQPWHSAVEFKRYLHRFMLEFTRIETLGGVRRTVYNQYDSLVRPLQRWLTNRGVRMMKGCVVTEIDHAIRDGRFMVTSLRYREHDQPRSTLVEEDDLVILQNGSMTDASSLGSMTKAPASLTRVDSGGWDLWERLAKEPFDFGNPAAFNRCIAQSCWESFTVTLKAPAFFDAMEQLSGNEAGTGGLVTFKDSNWLMSIVLAHQPHFADQPRDVQVFWGYALLPDRIGNFIAKPMAECSGAEILHELCGHLRFDLQMMGPVNCIPCRMPYITSMFMPREKSDRPLPIPRDTKNFAFVSQFVELETDVVFTVEYSVRAAQIAVYGLLGIDREIPAITPHDQSRRTQFDAVVKAFA